MTCLSLPCSSVTLRSRAEQSGSEEPRQYTPEHKDQSSRAAAAPGQPPNNFDGSSGASDNGRTSQGPLSGPRSPRRPRRLLARKRHKLHSHCAVWCRRPIQASVLRNNSNAKGISRGKGKKIKALDKSNADFTRESRSDRLPEWRLLLHPSEKVPHLHQHLC